MKKSLGTYIAQNFKMPQLYRDDLEAIEKIIHQNVKPKKYGLSFNGFVYDGVDDIPSDILSTSVLVIHTSQPSLRLKFTRSWSELYTGEDIDGTETAIRRIAQIVARGERRGLWTFCHSSAWLAPLLGCGSLGLGMAWIGMGLLAKRYILLVVLMIVLMSIWWALGFRYKLYRFSEIDLQEARPDASWVSLHQRGILLFAVGLLLGGAAALLLTRFFASA